MEDFSKLISYLFHSRTQVHVFHLQTNSFAEHMALQGYYDNIIELIDKLVESYQGKYGIVKDYTSFNILPYENKQQVITYFDALYNTINAMRQGIIDSYLQNQIDGIVELTEQTLYKLKYLN
jgi:hypothetical protein